MTTEASVRHAPAVRRAGLLAIIAGAVLVLASRYGRIGGQPGEAAGLALMVGGWAAFAVALYLKRRAQQAARGRAAKAADAAKPADTAP